MSCQGSILSGPVGASLGRLTPQAAQIQEVMAKTVQQHMQDRFFNYTTEKRGSRSVW